MEASDAVLMLSRLWPIFVAFILLIVTLAQAHYRIKVLEEDKQSKYGIRLLKILN